MKTDITNTKTIASDSRLKTVNQYEEKKNEETNIDTLTNHGETRKRTTTTTNKQPFKEELTEPFFAPLEKTTHKIVFGDARETINQIEDQSIALVVTSPPYPMIQMWDEVFFAMNPEIKQHIEQNNHEKAYELMHEELNKVWSALYDKVIDGGIVCINIGDATRTVKKGKNKNYQLFPNHATITQKMLENGFQQLPSILWVKTTNKPNKFMGSGTLPTNAYVTLEHEHILVFRKKGKRTFKNKYEKFLRSRSAYFWEERNQWFSDQWVITGEKQDLSMKTIKEKTPRPRQTQKQTHKNTDNKSKNKDAPNEHWEKAFSKREKTAEYPLEIPLRLILMYSIYGDTVLDPFLGTGTTTIASVITGRNSVGIEIDTAMKKIITNRLLNTPAMSHQYVKDRYEKHAVFTTNTLKTPVKPPALTPKKPSNKNSKRLKNADKKTITKIHKYNYTDSILFKTGKITRYNPFIDMPVKTSHEEALILFKVIKITPKTLPEKQSTPSTEKHLTNNPKTKKTPTTKNRKEMIFQAEILPTPYIEVILAKNRDK